MTSAKSRERYLRWRSKYAPPESGDRLARRAIKRMKRRNRQQRGRR